MSTHDGGGHRLAAVGGRILPADAVTLEAGENLSNVVIVAEARPFVPAAP